MAGENEGTETPQMTGEDEGINVDETVADLAESLNLVEKEEDKGGASEDAGSPEAPATAGERPSVEASPATEGAPPAQTPAGDQAPDTWRKEAKEKWAAVDPAIKAEIAKREGDVAKFVNDATPSFQVTQALNKVLEPFYPLLQKYNLDPLQHISGLLNAHTTLLFGRPEVKAQMFRNLAQQAGIDISKLGDPNSAAEGNTQQLAYIRQLEERVARMEQGVTGVTQTLHEGRAAELEQGIMAFANDAGHPFFWELAESGEIKALIDAGAARTLKDAYELALYRNPVTRAKQLDLEGKRKQEADAKQNAERVAASRRATRANVKSRGSGRPQAAEESIDDTLRTTLADIHSRQL